MTGAFPGWLKRQIALREWSVTEFSRRLGVNHGTVSMWLSGARNPSPKSIDKITDILGVDNDIALTMAGHRPPVFEVDPDSAEAQLIPLIRQVDWASRPGRVEEMQAELREMIKYDRKQKRRNE